MPVKVRVGDRNDLSDVYESGSVIAPEGGSVELAFEDITLLMNFETGPDAEVKIYMAGVGNDANLTVVNCNSDRGTYAAIPLGRIDWQPIVLHLFVHAIGDRPETRLVNYTLALGKRATP